MADEKAKRKSRSKKGRKQSGYAFGLGKTKDGTYYKIKPDATPAGDVDTDANNELANCFDAFEDIVTTIVTKKRHLGAGSGVHIEIANVPPP